jgi:hypothetical protein
LILTWFGERAVDTLVCDVDAAELAINERLQNVSKDPVDPNRRLSTHEDM